MTRVLSATLMLLAGLCYPQVGRTQFLPTDPTLIRPTIFDQVGTIVRSAAQATAAKAAFNQEIRTARANFFGGCAHGVRDPAASDAFASLLLQKDIYYLSLYLFEGMTPDAQRRVNATDTLTGGTLDGGLTAIGPFGTWTEAVRNAMHAPPSGQFWLPPSPAEALTAIQSTAPQYALYQSARDRLEFDKWHSTQPVPALATASPTGPANTPEERAARYADYVLKPQIQRTVSQLPEDQREEARAKLTAWGTRMRNAIVGYETMEATPQLIGDYLHDAHYPDDIAESAIASFANMHPATPAAANAAALSVLSQARQQWDLRLNPRSRPLEPVLKVFDLALHSFAYARGAGRLTSEEGSNLSPGVSRDLLTYLFLVERPHYKCCTSYEVIRSDIITGQLRPEPAAPAQPAQNVDLCTGARVAQSATPVPASPPSPAASSHLLIEHKIVPFTQDMLGDNIQATRAMGTLLPNGADKWATVQQLSTRIVQSGKYKVLECTYADSKTAYHFWHDAVPPYFSQLTLAVTIGGVEGDAARLGTKTVEDCPADEHGAGNLQNTLLHTLDRPNTNGMQPDELIIPLSHEKVGAVAPLQTSYSDRSNIVKPENVNGFNSAVALAIAKHQQVLECDFVVYDHTQSYFFWYKTAPDNVAALIGLVSGYNGVLTHMGTTGRDQCPSNFADARKASSELTQQSARYIKY